MSLDFLSRYYLDMLANDTLEDDILEYRHSVRQYCHNCGEYGHLNEVNILGIKFALCDDCFKEFQEKQNYCPVLTYDKAPWWMNPDTDANKVTC